MFLQLLDILLYVGPCWSVNDHEPHVSVNNLAGAYFHHLCRFTFSHVAIALL